MVGLAGGGVGVAFGLVSCVLPAVLNDGRWSVPSGRGFMISERSHYKESVGYKLVRRRHQKLLCSPGFDSCSYSEYTCDM